ncbi:PD-(D/E)XK nuclease-like domain-containing protein [Apilactobacillus xinyiensis]|uniref:PD-(D/E)XK nuclease-like domain-containing protein n=1 Tax=Apilactobacillus xinyiensis TaxID=2841032 RepID=UPI003364C314
MKTKQDKKAYSTTSTTFQLNDENYYSNQANWHFQSKSIFWNFMQCEAAALAQLKHEYQPFSNPTPLLFGNYLHSYFESKQAHERFIKANENSLYKYGNKEKGLKSDFKQAQKCIKTLENEERFKLLYQGQKEVIVKGQIFGVDWMGKIDCLDLKHKCFFDLKTVDDIHKKHWNKRENGYTNFAVDRGYDMQMAIYKELIKQMFDVDCTPFIIAVSKQSTPDKAMLSIPEWRIEDRMNQIEELQPHIQRVKNGEEEPNYCGHCDYCRSHKIMNEINSIDDIELY